MTPAEIKVIADRHKGDQKIYNSAKIEGHQSHKDRGELLDHISERKNFGSAIGYGCGSSMGKAFGFVTVWWFTFWLFRHDLENMARWFVAHVRVLP